MKIRLILVVEDDDDMDETSTTGLTEAAYNRLYEAVTDAGFAVDRGPDRWEAKP